MKPRAGLNEAIPHNCVERGARLTTAECFCYGELRRACCQARPGVLQMTGDIAGPGRVMTGLS